MAVNKISYTESIREGTDKINQSIDQSNQAIDKAKSADTKADSAISTANQANTKSDDTQQQLNNIVINNGESDAEVLQARGSYSVLNERLSAADEFLADLVYNVKNYKNPAEQNFSAAFQRANDALVAVGGGTLYVPRGTYLANFTLDSNVQLKGDGIDVTTIKSVPGSNKDVIQGRDFATFTGTTADVDTEGVRFIAIKNLTIDGNKANNTAGCGIRLWGSYWYWENVVVQNCINDGIWTEFTSILPPTPDTAKLAALESMFRNIKVLYCNGNAWTFNGPHDSIIDNYVAIGNAGWSFYQRNFNSFVTMENVNTWKNGNGIHVGTGIAGHDIITDNDGTGIGMEFEANTGNSRIVNLRLYGWSKGLVVKGQAQRITGVVSNCTTGVEVDKLSISELNLSCYQNNTTMNIVSETSKNNYNIVASIPSGGILLSGVNIRSDSNVSLNAGGSGFHQFAENSLKVKGWTFTFPTNNGEILTENSTPTTTKRGGIKTQNALPDVTSPPTAGEFNTLLSRLRAAGILSSS
jgi:hypothetical protein